MIFGRVIDLSFTQTPNAIISIAVTLSGILTASKEVHHQKAAAPMFVTLSGIVTEVRTVQCLKAP